LGKFPNDEERGSHRGDARGVTNHSDHFVVPPLLDHSDEGHDTVWAHRNGDGIEAAATKHFLDIALDRGGISTTSFLWLRDRLWHLAPHVGDLRLPLGFRR
jgi:hypothetical protein